MERYIQEDIMSQSAASSAVTPARAGKVLNIVLWGVQILLALAFLGAASGKLLGKPEMVGLFDAIGIGQWFRYVTGLLETAGAILVVVPRTKAFGAALLAVVMVGAVLTHLFLLHNAPTAAAVLLVLAGTVVWGRRGDLNAALTRLGVLKS
jgi:putative oxidoreductase